AVWRHAQAHLTAEMRAALATRLLQREGDTRRILLEEGAGVIDVMAALKRSLAQETRATGGTTANERPVRPAADRRQRSLLLPVAGGRRRREKTATEPAAVAVRKRHERCRDSGFAKRMPLFLLLLSAPGL